VATQASVRQRRQPGSPCGHPLTFVKGCVVVVWEIEVFLAGPAKAHRNIVRAIERRGWVVGEGSDVSVCFSRTFGAEVDINTELARLTKMLVPGMASRIEVGQLGGARLSYDGLDPAS
jgi:hypothetical protein